VVSSSTHDGDAVGVATFRSPYSFDDTVQRLLAVLAERGIKVFATIDQRAEAVAAGLSMPPTTLIVYGNPKAGTPVMLANPQAGLDLPLKALVVELAQGQVDVLLNRADYIIQRHALPTTLAANLIPAERLIAAVLGH
jgi:uncharacterized protein (DUF302 family)